VNIKIRMISLALGCLGTGLISGPAFATGNNQQNNCDAATLGNETKDGSRADMAKLRRCLNSLSATASGTDSNFGNTLTSYLSTLANAYDSRAMRQGTWLGSGTYTTLASTAGIGGTPELAYVAAIPILADRVEQYGSTRALYSLGQDGLGFIRAYYRNINELTTQLTTSITNNVSPHTTTCNELKTLAVAGAITDADVKGEVKQVLDICDALDAATVSLTLFGRQFQTGSQTDALALNKALLCDVTRFDRYLSQRDELTRSVPSEALSDAVAIIPTLIQGLIARKDLNLQQVGRTQGLVSGIVLRTGNPTLTSLSTTVFPQVPTRLGSLSGKTIAALPNFAAKRDELIPHLATMHVRLTNAERVRNAFKPVYLGYSVDATTSTIKASQLAETGVSPTDVSGC
jgi:hypothetical protein